MKEILEKEISEKEVPGSELKITPIRCSKPGGQNVNKGMMGREIRWNCQESETFTDEEKERIYEKVKLTQKGEIVISATRFKSAEQNRKDGIERLNEKINKALEREEERIPIKKRRSVKEREKEQRKRHSKKKRERREKKTRYY